MATAMSTYRETAAPAALVPFVSCVWEQWIGPGDHPYEQPVYPDGSIDLVVADGRAFVAGPATAPIVANLEPATVTLGLRLRRSAAAAVLGTSAHDLVDRDVPFEALWGRAGAVLAERVRAASPRQRVARLSEFVRARLSDGAGLDRQVAAASLILDTVPQRSLGELCDATGLSARQLRRRVTDTTGYSPRLLAAVLRFQRFLRSARATPAGHRDLARLAAEAGYADQPHLTRECRRFTGLPPAALLADEARRLGD